MFWEEVKRKYLSLEHLDLIGSYIPLNTIVDNYQEID